MIDWKSRNVTWHTVDPHVRFVKWEQEGDVAVGYVLHHHPTCGALNYDRSADIGVLVLEEEPGRWCKIGLDKGQLATAVDNALISARREWQAGPGSAGFVMAVRFVGWSDGIRKGHKLFKATIGMEREHDIG